MLHDTIAYLLLMAITLPCIAGDSTISPVTLTNSGPVVGFTEYFENCPLQVYFGVPFAKPPVDELRFKRTKPIKPWSEPIFAVQQPPACYQYSTVLRPGDDNTTHYDENCLFLNIWVPLCSADRTGKKSVMYWVYGGGFETGSIRLSLYDGKALATKGDVIVVTVNYRLGPLGFLFSDTMDAPGNMGLYDIFEGLKWVHNNIETFGGDKHSVTIMGESVGSISVGLLALSPLTKGLYKRVIMESESPLFQFKSARQNNLQHSEILAKAFNCSYDGRTIGNSPKKVVHCLRKIGPLELVKTAVRISSGAQRQFAVQFGDPLVPVEPTQTVLSGQFENTDLFIGNNGDEGSIFIAIHNMQLFGPFGGKRPFVNKTLGSNILRTDLVNFPDPQAAVDYYLGHLGENQSSAIVQAVFKAYGDIVLLCPQVFFAEKFAEKGSNVYYYFFTHRPRNTPWPPYFGVTHFDEVQFVFGRPVVKPTRYTAAEVDLSQRMLKLWTNFAKYGVPDDTWPLYSEKNQCLKILNTSTSLISSGPHKSNCKFVKSVYKF